MASEDFKIGDLVWAKMKGYPPWPARVVEPQPDAKPPPRTKNVHYVYFFGSDNFAWISVDCIKPHSESFLSTVNKKKSRAYQNAVDALMNYINEFKDNKESPIKKETDLKKPITKVVRSVSKKRPRESYINANDYCQRKVPKFEDSLDSSGQQIFISPELHEEEIMGNIMISDVTPTVKKIGFIGLGDMGQAIVKNLLRSGHSVTIWNQSQSKCDAFVKLGAMKVKHASDLISECDITFCCVSDPQASKTLIFGKHGILKGLEQSLNSGQGGKGYVEMTSIDRDTSLAISEAIVRKQGRYLEAPVFGTSKNAIEGSLLFLVSGDQKLFLDCITCFHAMGRHAYYVSCDVGNGIQMSLMLSMVYDTVSNAAAETIALAEMLNLSHEEFSKIVSDGPLNCKDIIEKCKMMNDLNPPSITALEHIQKGLDLSLMMDDKFQPILIHLMKRLFYIMMN